MEKLTIVTKLARQYEGEYVFISVLKAFKEKAKAEQFIQEYSFSRTETINGIDCICEIGIFTDVDIE